MQINAVHPNIYDIIKVVSMDVDPIDEQVYLLGIQI
jgi:hypothetical protein